MKRFFFLTLLFFYSYEGLFAGEPKFYLSQTRAELGDPVFVVAETDGSAEIRILEKEFQGHGIRAVYWGMEESTTIVNFRAYRKKLLKYRLVVSAPGKYSVPEVVIDQEGKKYGATGLLVEFGPRRSASRSPGSIWNRFFSTEDNQGPADGDLKVVFQLDKKEVWVGESVLGFFALYYRNSIRPYFDRDPSSSIEFPYFRSEVISGVGLKIPDEVVYDGLEYETSPYNKEFFVLTPLKKGEYSLGSTGFHLEGQLQSYFHMRTVKTIPSRILVKDLPSPSPNNFEGAVGKFEIVEEAFPTEAYEGESFSFKFSIRGKGNLSSVKDPLRAGCGDPGCFPEITLVQVRPQREFRELDPGQYGFYLSSTYAYSVLPKEQGIWKHPDLKFSYFDPEAARYKDASIRFPTIVVKPARPKTADPEMQEEKRSLLGKLSVGIITGFALLGAAWFGFGFWKKARSRVEVLKRLDLWIGSKRGFVLKHSAMSKGLSDEEASLLAGWKSEDIPITETYRRLGPPSQAVLLRTAERLLIELKKEESS